MDVGESQYVRDHYTTVKFRETPPGALGATTVVAAVSAVLIAILTFTPPTGNADTAALLLAVPLFATTLVGNSIERAQRSSLAKDRLSEHIAAVSELMRDKGLDTPLTEVYRSRGDAPESASSTAG